MHDLYRAHVHWGLDQPRILPIHCFGAQHMHTLFSPSACFCARKEAVPVSCATGTWWWHWKRRRQVLYKRTLRTWWTAFSLARWSVNGCTQLARWLCRDMPRDETEPTRHDTKIYQLGRPYVNWARSGLGSGGASKSRKSGLIPNRDDNLPFCLGVCVRQDPQKKYISTHAARA